MVCKRGDAGCQGYLEQQRRDLSRAGRLLGTSQKAFHSRGEHFGHANFNVITISSESPSLSSWLVTLEESAGASAPGGQRTDSSRPAAPSSPRHSAAEWFKATGMHL